MLLATYVVTAAGIPLPVVRQPAKSGELFPCAMNGCGCDSAERCWRSCCCHTLAERLAWAEKHGVRPPEFAIAEAERNGINVSRLADSSASATQPKTCCARKAVNSKQSCCASHHKEPSAPTKTVDHIVGWRALACHGQSLNWLAAVPTLISASPELTDQLPLVAWLGPHASQDGRCVADLPSVPPPERA